MPAVSGPLVGVNMYTVYMYTVNMFTVYMFTFQEGAALAFPELSPIGAPAAMREPSRTSPELVPCR